MKQAAELEFWGSCSEEGKPTKKGYMGYHQSCCSFLFNTHTSNVVQYYVGSSTNPSIRTTDLQMATDFTMIRINHGDMEGY